MKRILLFILFMFSLSNLYAQGAADCATALASPISVGTPYANQGTCGNGNNFSVYDGQDKIYAYCATQSGCITVNLSNMESGDSTLPCRARVRAYDTCVSSSSSLSTLLGSSAKTLPAFTDTTSDVFLFNVVAGHCYYLLFDVQDNSTSYADCMFYDFQLNFSANLVQTPGANNCAASVLNPTTIGASYSNQTLCCTGNNFFSAGNDWYYTFCPPSDGCLQINVDSIFNNDNNSTYGYMQFYIYDSCNIPSNGSYSSSYINQFSIQKPAYGKDSFIVEVKANKCYTIVFTSPYAMGKGGCIDYNFSSSFTPKFVQTPGAEICDSAYLQPLLANTKYNNQTICGSRCEGTQQWTYEYCANADGCGTFILDSIFNANASGTQYFYLLKDGSQIDYKYHYVNTANNGIDSVVMRFQIDSGSCYCLRIYSGNEAQCIDYVIYLDVTTGGVQNPGGNTVALAQTQPVVLGSSYTNQTTCCMRDDFGQSGEDWIYTFIPNKDGCVRVAVDSFINANAGFYGEMYLRVEKSSNSNQHSYSKSIGNYPYADSMKIGPEIFLNVDSGELYEIYIDGYTNQANNYDICTNYTLSLAYYDSMSAQLPGGNTMAVALANPLVPNTTYIGQTTCCMYNDTGSHKGQDWIYTFCPTQTGCYELLFENIISGDPLKPTEYYIDITSSNNSGSWNYQNTISSTMANDTLSMALDSGVCYTIIIDAGQADNDNFNCINYDLRFQNGSLTQFPGGNTFPTALVNVNQLVYNTPYHNQTTCCKLNDYTSYQGQDWFYAFTAPQSGNYTFKVFNTRENYKYNNSSSTYNSSYYLGVLDTSLAYIKSINGNASNVLDTTGARVSFCADSGEVYYLWVDDYDYQSSTSCLDYSVVVTDFFATPNLGYSNASTSYSDCKQNQITNLNTIYDSIPFCCGNPYQYFTFQAPADGCIDYQLKNPQFYSINQSLGMVTRIYKIDTTNCNNQGHVVYNLYDTTSTTFTVEAGQFYQIRIYNSYYNYQSNCLEIDMDIQFNPIQLNSVGGLNCEQAQLYPVGANTYYTNQENCKVPCAINDKHKGYDLTCLSANVDYHDYTYFFKPGQVGKYILSVDSITSLANSLSNNPVYNKMQVAVYKNCSTSYPYYINSVAEDEMPMYDTTTNANMTLEFYAQSPTDSFFIVFDAGRYYTADTNCYKYNFQLNLDNTAILGCNNSDFESGGTNGWVLSEGLSIEGSNSSACPSPTYSACPTIVTSGPRHTIMSGGTDYFGGFPRVGAGAYSLKLGDSIPGAKAEAMEMKFLVDSTNANFQYSYAVVFQDPGHQPKSQPFFRAKIKDAYDNLVSCTEYCVSANSSIPGFSLSPNSGVIDVLYKPWDTVQVDLTAYIGTIVTVQIENGDCSDGGHFGYSYFDANCTAPISPANVVACTGFCDTIIGPIGYTNYSWSPGNVSSKDLIVCPTVSTVYTLTYETYSGCVLQKDYIYNVPTPFTLSSTSSCYNNGSATVNVSGNLGTYYYAWNTTPVQNTQTATNLGNGTYSVTVTDGACYTVTTSVVINNALPTISTISQNNVSCFGDTNGAVSVSATSTQGNCIFSWNTTPNQTNAAINNLAAGTYTVTATDTIGCSSQVAYVISSPPVLAVSVTAPSNCDSFATNLATAVVSGGTPPYTYSWQSNSSTSSTANYLVGTYTLQITDSNNCTTIDTFSIISKPNTQTNLSQVICTGQSYLGYTTTGVHKDTFLSANGCDSIRILNLTVNQVLLVSVNHTMCPGQSFQGYTTAGTHIDTFSSVTNCDSIRTLNLLINSVALATVNQSICQGQSFQGYATAGTYVDTFTSSSNCDSIRTLNLVIDSFTYSSLSQTICQGQTYLGYANTGTYLDTFQNVNGCDSIRTLNLLVNQHSSATINKNICTGQTFLGYSVTGIYIDTLTNSVNCDSVRTLNLIVNNLTFATASYTICHGQTYQGYTTAGTYIDTFQNASGCDSVQTLNLFVNPRTYSTLNETICQGQSYLGYNSTGTYIDTLVNANTCDSIRTLNLTVNPTQAFTVNQTICQPNSYLGYSATGTYIDTFSNQYSCDSIRTLNLIVNPITYSTLSQTICTGQSYLGYTTAGTYIDTLANANGCDSVRTLTLSMNAVSNSFVIDTICEGQILLGHSTTGIYSDTLTNSAGCDSVRTLNLTVISRTFNTLSLALCDGNSYLGHSTTGTFIDTLVNVNGCDSIHTLELLINPNYTLDTTIRVCIGDRYFAAGAWRTASGVFTDSFQTVANCDSVVRTTLDFFYELTPNIWGDSTFCEGDSVLLHAGVYSHYLWNIGDTTDRIIVKNSGLFIVNVRNESVCYGIDTIGVEMYDLPDIEIDFNQKELCKFDTIELNGSGAETYRWYSNNLRHFIGSENPINYSLEFSPIRIFLEGIDANECENIDSMTLVAVNCCGKLFIPNAFTPNGDGKNDKFKPIPKGTTKYEQYRLEIFNRWGQKVFTSEDIDEYWDGNIGDTHNEMGSYYYIIRAKCYDDDEVQIIKGDLMMIR